MGLVIVSRQDAYLRTGCKHHISCSATVQTGERNLVGFLIDVFSISRQDLHVIVRLLAFLLVLCLIIVDMLRFLYLCVYVYRFRFVMFYFCGLRFPSIAICGRHLEVCELTELKSDPKKGPRKAAK